MFCTGDCCVVEMNTEGKSFHNPCVARIRMAEKGHWRDGAGVEKSSWQGRRMTGDFIQQEPGRQVPHSTWQIVATFIRIAFISLEKYEQDVARCSNKVLNQVRGYHIIIIVIIIMNVVGLGLYVQLYLTQSLSDNPVLSIFFLGDIYCLFHAVDTVVLFWVSGFFPLCLHVQANIVGSFWSHMLHFPDLVCS